MSDTVTLLQQEYRLTRRNSMMFLLFIALCGICLFWNRVIALVLMGLAVGVQWFVLRKQQKRYTQNVTQQNLMQTVCKQLDASEPDSAGGGLLTLEKLISARLMPMEDHKHACLMRQGISGTVNGFQIQLCDATLAQTFRLSAKGKRRVHYNAGAWIHIMLPQDSGQNWRVLDETSVPTPIRMDYFSKQFSMESAILQDGELSKKMVLYRPIDQPQQHPSKKTLQQLKRLVNYTTGFAAVSIQGNSLHIFLRGRFLSRPVSMQKPPALELLEFDPLPELRYCIQLAESL